MKLLEQAMATRKTFRNNVTAEDKELVKAWLNNKVSLQQIRQVKKFPHVGSVYTYIAITTREIWADSKK